MDTNKRHAVNQDRKQVLSIRLATLHVVIIWIWHVVRRRCWLFGHLVMPVGEHKRGRLMTALRVRKKLDHIRFITG